MSRKPISPANGPMRTVSIRLTEETIARLKAVGEGSLTAGVRRLLTERSGNADGL